MSILDWLGLKRETAEDEAGETETVRRIVGELRALPPEQARYVAAFAFVLARVAHAEVDAGV